MSYSAQGNFSNEDMTTPTPTTTMLTQLNQAIHTLTVNQQQLQQTIDAQNQEIMNLHAQTTARATTTQLNPPCLPDFKMPSIKPITFTGNIKHMPVHQLQNFLDDYLKHSLETCKLYNLAQDINSTTHVGQPTYIQFVSSGLTEHARTSWRHVSEEEHSAMTWNGYCNWILTNFGSTLTLSQAVEGMEDLCQTKSAILYSAQFNKIVTAIKAASITYPDHHLCIKYLNGLKPHLQTVPNLYRITEDLKKLHQEAEKLDDIQFCHLIKIFNPSQASPHSTTQMPIMETSILDKPFPVQMMDQHPWSLIT
ncbi:hypothetical protein HDU82_003689, partial [Entophlyctis luteolus]